MASASVTEQRPPPSRTARPFCNGARFLGARAVAVIDIPGQLWSRHMTALFILYTKNPLLADLTQHFIAVGEVTDSVNRLAADLKARQDERAQLNKVKLTETNVVAMLGTALIGLRAYDVAAIRLEIELSELRSKLSDLFKVVEAVREALRSPNVLEFIAWGNECAIAQNNVICAIELLDKSCALEHEVIYKQLFIESRWIYFGIRRMYASLEAGENNANPREFVIKASGHGSKYRFDGENPDSPPPGPYMTFEEAAAKARHWCGYADTIGGDAAVCNVRTDEEIYNY